MAVGPYAWSLTAADNDDADANINWAEGQTPASINNSARAVMAAARGWINGALGGIGTNGGSSNAYTYANPTVAVWASLADGNRVCIEANHTNTGAATLAVDGLTAKAIRKGATTALASGDIVSGARYDLVYDAGNDVFQLVGGGVSTLYQPVDATLTALAALSWSSGNALVQFTAAETVSLTLTPSVTSVTATNATGATTAAGAFKNTTDAAAVQALRIEGDRATPTAGDTVYASFYMSDASGNQDEFARITCYGEALTNGSEVAQMRFGLNVLNVFTEKLILAATALVPFTSGGLTLGSASGQFGGVFLTEGATINWDNGDLVLTQTGNLLALTSGALQAPLAVSTETSGTLTAASANKKVKMSGDCTINDGVFAADDWIIFENNSASTRQIIQDTGMTLRLHGTATTGTRVVAIRGGASVGFDTNAEAIVFGDVT